MKTIFLAASVLALTCCTAGTGMQGKEMSFFITSVGSGDGANLGGLAGADAHCAALAADAGSQGKTWRAYLSTQTSNGMRDINARDRIGSGPWYNAKGVMIAANLEQLHSEAAMTGKENSLDENGNRVNGRGDSPNQHDILTGSNLDGTAFNDGSNHTCNNWTSNDAGTAQVGHFDRVGGGANPTSWNSAHGSRGCSQQDLIGTGGNGYFYCFATN
ncbi:MAG: hypothetical protein R3332_09320 [Pseudohongiellaceae bacterium]|nr:hypothetical protein [Pseudohongiellaceae bacterium]